MDDRRPLGGQPARGERWVVRRRLADGSATDVIGWVEEVAPEVLVLTDAVGVTHRIARGTIIASRRAPAAAGGPHPGRTSPARLERIASWGWVDRQEPLGEWVLRAADGFTREANSCLAVGDPERAVEQAAAAILAWSDRHRIPPLAQAVVGSDEEAALRRLGWEAVGARRVILVGRLSGLLASGGSDERVQVHADLGPEWLSTCAAAWDVDPDAAAVRRLLEGRPPRAFAAWPLPGRFGAIGRGHLREGWIGITCVWSETALGRGPVTAVLLGLGHWAARRGARNVYVGVAGEDEATLAACAGLGLAAHHAYVHLAPPG